MEAHPCRSYGALLIFGGRRCYRHAAPTELDQRHRRDRKLRRSDMSIEKMRCDRNKIEVGTRVAPRPPHRSRRAVFQHRALHDISLTHLTERGYSTETAHRGRLQRPRSFVESAQDSIAVLSLLWPAERLASSVPSFLRLWFPLQAAMSR